MRAGILIVLTCLFVTAPAVAQEEGQTRELVPLEQILDGISQREGLTFTLMPQVSASIAMWQLDTDELTYAQLHTVLSNYGLAAVAAEDVIKIIPVAIVRQHPMPTLTGPDDSIPDDQWVTWTYRVQRANAVMFVPIVRPMVPQQGHLVAHPPSSTVVIVDRYANARRLIDLIREMDENSTEIQEE